DELPLEAIEWEQPPTGFVPENAPAAVDTSGLAEGAAFAVLRSGAGDVELCGWSVTGPHDVHGAVSQALETCREVDGVFACLPDGGLDGTVAARTPLGVFDAHAAFG